MMTKNILLTGIGGQGTILASKLLTLGLMEAGYDVKMSEVHGMSQREGPVLTHVRYGDQVYSPVVEKGTAHVLIGFEQLEVLRNLDYLGPEGTVVMNTAQVDPIGVLAGLEQYPSNIADLVRQRAKRLVVVDASAEAEKLGNRRVMNIILLGTIIKAMGLEDINWQEIIAQNVKADFVEINQAALALGRSLL